MKFLLYFVVCSGIFFSCKKPSLKTGIRNNSLNLTSKKIASKSDLLYLKKQNSNKADLNVKTKISLVKKTNANVVFKPKPINSNIKKTIVNQCKGYLGTPYAYGGNSCSGIDCSGLIYESFKSYGISIPRISYQQANYFDSIVDESYQVGDLVYFNVKGGCNIEHTGIISQVSTDSNIRFIHASASRGVVEEPLNTNYWKSKIIKATRPKLYFQ